MILTSGVVDEVLHRPGPEHYTSRFNSWDRRSSVRTKPRRLFPEFGGDDQVFFPPEFVPVLKHPDVAARGPEVRRRLLIHALYQYLHFTVILEQTAVLPVTAQISVGRSGISLPPAMRHDAFKITTDEAWHAQFSHDFIQEIARATGVRPLAVAEPEFVNKLSSVREEFEPAARALADLFFTIVSETLVSALLAEIPNDRRLPVPVRALVGDHAEDEGKHHAYFRSFLHFLWPRLSPAERRLIGPRVPDFVRIFLQPDLSSVIRALRSTGFGEQQAAGIVADCYPRGRRHDRLRDAARWTVQAFREIGSLDDRLVYDSFLSAGLIDECNN